MKDRHQGPQEHWSHLFLNYTHHVWVSPSHVEILLNINLKLNWSRSTVSAVTRCPPVLFSWSQKYSTGFRHKMGDVTKAAMCNETWFIQSHFTAELQLPLNWHLFKADRLGSLASRSFYKLINLIFLIHPSRALQALLTSCYCWWQTSGTTLPTCKARCTASPSIHWERTFLLSRTAGWTTWTVWTQAQERSTGTLCPAREEEALKEAGGENENLTEETVTGKVKDSRKILRLAVNIWELDSKYI